MGPAQLAAAGHDVEAQVLARAVRWHAERVALARAVRWHAEHRVLLHGRRTVIFR